jgi:hypothetical protein
MILPGGESTDSLLPMFRLLKKQDYDITGLPSQSQIIWEIQSHLIWNLTLGSPISCLL